MPDVYIAWRCLRQHYVVEPGQELVVALGGLTAALVPVSEATQLGSENYRLDRVQARIEAQIGVDVLPLTAVVAKQPDLASHCRRASHHRARITIGA